MKIDSLICPVCNGTHYKEVYKGFNYISDNNENKTFSIIKCKKCGIARNYPLPYQDDISADVYQDFSYIDPYLNNKLWDTFFIPIIDTIKKYKKVGKVLDIGCSSGYLLKLAKDNGYSTYGVELNPSAVKYGNENYNLNIINTDLKAVNFDQNYFDVIICSQLMEHIVKPEYLLSEIYRILKKDGILIIDSPNYAGILVKFMGKKWGGYQPQWHIWQFTPKSIKALLHRNKFNVINVSCRQNIYTNSPNGLFKKFIFYTFFKIVFTISQLINRADKLLVVARKN